MGNEYKERQIIIIEGVPSAGKTTVARELSKRILELTVIHGDREIQKWNRRRPRSSRDLFRALLDLVERTSSSHDVVLDMTLPDTYLRDARQRFPDAFLVSLRITEEQRLARERQRKRRRPLLWNEDIAVRQAAEDQFDLVIDSSTRTPAECAELIRRSV